MTGDDHERLGDAAEELVEWVGNRAFMRIVAATADVEGGTAFHRCAALVIDPVAGTFLCSVYETRPAVCRELAQHGPGCHGELATKRERPARSLAVLRATS